MAYTLGILPGDNPHSEISFDGGSTKNLVRLMVKSSGAPLLLRAI